MLGVWLLMDDLFVALEFRLDLCELGLSLARVA